VTIALATVYVIWGSTYLAIRFAVESMPPFLMASARFLAPGIALCAWSLSRGARAPSAAQWRSAAIVGALLLAGGNGLVSWAEQWVPSALAALLVASIPLWMGVMQWMVERSARPGPRGVAGLALGFCGVAILVSPESGLGRDSRLLAGAAAVLLASALWAAGSLYSRRADLPESPVLAAGMQMLAGSACLAVVGTISGEWSRVDPGAISPRSGLALAYLSVFGSIVAYSAYIWLLRAASPAKVATYAYVNPLVAVVLGWALGGERLTSPTLAAAGIIVFSVVLITTDGRRSGGGGRALGLLIRRRFLPRAR
jgi:drug/metabolite transporter (DMT)-like permease